MTRMLVKQKTSLAKKPTDQRRFPETVDPVVQEITDIDAHLLSAGVEV